MTGVRHVVMGALVVAALALLPVFLRASVVVPMTLADLTESAALIVDGEVVDVRHVVGPEGAERLVLVRIASAWKGTAEEAVYVRLAGGRVGRYETRVPGVPAVTGGQRFVWFLAPHPRGGYSVLGLHQGALRMMAGPDGTPFVTAPARAATARGDVARLPRRLADVAADVRAILTGAPW